MKQNMHAVDRLVRVIVVAPPAGWLAVAGRVGTVPGSSRWCSPPS